MITIICEDCPICGQESELVLPDEIGQLVIEWISNGSPGFIQEALSMLDADQREQILTGAHAKCFDEMFPDE